MTVGFPIFARLVQEAFEDIVTSPDSDSDSDAFVVDLGEGVDLFQIYLEAFPEGTNPMFRERTEHDCNTCKQFIRRVGNVVAVGEDGSLQTVWDLAADEAQAPYDHVAQLMSEIVANAHIVDIFRTCEPSFGAKLTRSTDSDGNLETWNHLYTGEIPRHLRPMAPATERGNYRTTVQVFERGLQEISPYSIQTILELIDAKSLYRGDEHRAAVVAFQDAQQAYNASFDKNVFLWTRAKGPASRFRNSVIGTLAVDLSNGVDLEQAVRAFESKVAPHNYKRTTALITPGMVKEAMKTIKELDLEPSLERRFARLEDISVNDVLWVDSSVEPAMKDSLGESLLASAVTKRRKPSTKAEEISLDTFLEEVLPTAHEVEVLLKGQHLGNLMSLTAPVHPEPKQLFQWDNDFAWSYAGNIADSSIKERVKRAGGKVNNVQLRCSLSWYNFDDLDIHVNGPGGRICFSSPQGRCGGKLDVDMNVSADTREAVENIRWDKVPDGIYEVHVHNYTHRESKDVGFEVEVENLGEIHSFSYPKEVRNKLKKHVATLTVRDGKAVVSKIGPGIVTSAMTQEKWGLSTEQFVKVNAVTLSPNYWGENAVGNRHTFFVLAGAKNDEPTRGIYNEFLHPRLTKHRKVFEVIGEKTKCQPTEGQLSGLGFSSTKKEKVTVRVNKRLYSLEIGA